MERCQAKLLAFFFCLSLGFSFAIGSPVQARTRLRTSFSLAEISRLMANEAYFRSNEVAAQEQLFTWSLQSRGNLPKDGRFRLDSDFLMSSQEQQLYIHVPEFYVQWRRHQMTLQLGRKLQDWSWADQLWKRGLWQPRFLWDKLQPQEEGLLGAFLSGNLSSHSHWMLYISPFHVPETGPKIEVQNGHIVSHNPWLNPPVETVYFKGVKTPVLYSVNVPSTQSMVLNPGGGAQFAWSHSQDDFKASYAYKPMPGLLLAAPLKLDTEGPEDVPPLRVEVRPRVVYHHLGTIEWQHHFADGVDSFLSFTYEHPVEQQSLPSDWLIQQSLESRIYTAGVQVALNASRTTQWYVSLTQVSGGDEPVHHELLSGEYLFERRFQYQQAIKTGVNSWRQHLGRYVLNWSSEFIYDWSQNGVALVNRLGLPLNRHWALALDSEILGIVNNKAVVNEQDFLRDFRANDSLYAEIRYVF